MSSSVIPATTPVSWTKVPDGSAASPSFAFQNSSGTGIYRVSADVLGLSTAGVQRVVVDASGNVGIGTGSPKGSLHANGNVIVNNGAGFLGNLYYSGSWKYASSGSSLAFGIFSDTTGLSFQTAPGGGTADAVATVTERARIDASGNLLVGKTSSSVSASTGWVLAPTGPASFYSVNSATGTDGTLHIYNLNASFNGYRFYVLTNGGIANFSGNNVALSDERTKTDIKPAGSYLEKICAIPVRTFRYKDQGDDLEPTLGVIAQEVEAIAPELVNAADGFGETPEDGVPLKTIYTTDMQFALMKALQELSAKVDAQAAEIEALKAK